jgi:hypothetical protein
MTTQVRSLILSQLSGPLPAAAIQRMPDGDVALLIYHPLQDPLYGALPVKSTLRRSKAAPGAAIAADATETGSSEPA